MVDRTVGQIRLADQDSRTTFNDLLKNDRTGVFHSAAPGLVVLLIDRRDKLNNRRAWLRQFVLDTDVLIGAITRVDSNLLAILGRSRKTPLSDMEPLNIDTILTLAASTEQDLAQSYERNAPFAGNVYSDELLRFMSLSELNRNKIIRLILNGVDWAPILLSRDLTNTEYGQLLNITDQMLKGWSLANSVSYGNFPYATPISYPDASGVMDRIEKVLGEPLERLTFNWNTAGHGIVSPFGRFRVFSLDNTGALPVSYIPDEGNPDVVAAVESTLFDAEDEYGSFFANLRDPYITRVAQYAALHLMFQAFPVDAAREELRVSVLSYAKRWAGLRDAVLSSIKSMEEVGSSTEPIREDTVDHECGGLPPAVLGGAGKAGAPSAVNLVQRYSEEGEEKLVELADSIAYPRRVGRQLESRERRLKELQERYHSSVDSYNADVEACNRGNILMSKCSESFFLQRRLGIRELEERLEVQIGKWQESTRIYRDAETIRGSIRSFGGCAAAWRGVVSQNPESSESAYLTPSIVVSLPDQLLTMGGHNLDGRSLRTIMDSEIPLGRIRVSEDGNALRLNPRDVEKASAAARIYERARLRFAEGDPAYRRRLIDKAEATLASDTRIAKEFGGVALKLPDSEVVPVPLNRDTAQSVRVTLTDAEAASFRRVAEETGGDVVVSRADGIYWTVYPSGHPPIAMSTFSRAANQRNIQDLTAIVAESKPGTSKTVSIVSDGTLLRTDLQAVQVSAATQQVAAVMAGGGGRRGPPRPPRKLGSVFFGEGPKGQRKLTVFPFNRRVKRLLNRRDLDWQRASVSEQIIGSSGNQSIARVKIEVPIRRQPNFIRMRLQSFFRKRQASQEDLNILLETINREIRVSQGDKAVWEVIQGIRDSYEEAVGTDPILRIWLQDYSTDFLVVQLEPYDEGRTENGWPI